MDSLLAERELPGYPGAIVKLYYQKIKDQSLVKVTDHNGDHILTTTCDRATARDVYFHPFVFGYNYESRESHLEKVEWEDGS